jgi:hypothetical protein
MISGQGTKRAPSRSDESESSDGKASARTTSAQPANHGGMARTTAVLPTALNENWEVCALRQGVPKNEVLVKALSEYLSRQGLQPDKRPKTIEIIY